MTIQKYDLVSSTKLNANGWSVPSNTHDKTQVGREQGNDKDTRRDSGEGRRHRIPKPNEAHG